MGAPELYVWRDHKLVGHFRGGHKSTTFSYEPDVTIPISLSLPIGRKPQRRAALNYLENLLPEGLGKRKAMAAATDADSTNTFDLLASVDSAGGLTFTKTPEEPNPTLAPAVVMTDTDIESQVARIATGAGAYSSVDGRTRFSLAGQQGKFTATRLTDRWFWPSATLPSTHIFKPDSNRFEHVAKVEHACMELAHKMGRNVPTSSVSTIDGVDTYVVSRFDREVLSDGSVRRIHAEDLCQSLGIRPEDKYDPKAVDVAKVMHDGEMSDEDIAEWFSQMACSVLLGNCDAHAKNYSVFLDAKAPKPCPMYDIVSTLVLKSHPQRIHSQRTRHLIVVVQAARSRRDYMKLHKRLAAVCQSFH